MRWVHLGKGQVAQQDRVKTTMTVPDTGFLQPIKFHKMGAFHRQDRSKKWVLPRNTNVEHKYILSTIVTEELRWVHGGKGQVAQLDRVKTTMPGPDTGFLQPI
jgi:hypothetical protein